MHALTQKRIAVTFIFLICSLDVHVHVAALRGDASGEWAGRHDGSVNASSSEVVVGGSTKVDGGSSVVALGDRAPHIDARHGLVEVLANTNGRAAVQGGVACDAIIGVSEFLNKWKNGAFLSMVVLDGSDVTANIRALYDGAKAAKVDWIVKDAGIVGTVGGFISAMVNSIEAFAHICQGTLFTCLGLGTLIALGLSLLGLAVFFWPAFFGAAVAAGAASWSVGLAVASYAMDGIFSKICDYAIDTFPYLDYSRMGSDIYVRTVEWFEARRQNVHSFRAFMTDVMKDPDIIHTMIVNAANSFKQRLPAMVLDLKAIEAKITDTVNELPDNLSWLWYIEKGACVRYYEQDADTGRNQKEVYAMVARRTGIGGVLLRSTQWIVLPNDARDGESVVLDVATDSVKAMPAWKNPECHFPPGTKLSVGIVGARRALMTVQSGWTVASPQYDPIVLDPENDDFTFKCKKDHTTHLYSCGT